MNLAHSMAKTDMKLISIEGQQMTDLYNDSLMLQEPFNCMNVIFEICEVQKITRLRGTVYIHGRQSGGSMVAVLSSAARKAGRESVMGGRWE